MILLSCTCVSIIYLVVWGFDKKAANVLQQMKSQEQPGAGIHNLEELSDSQDELTEEVTYTHTCTCTYTSTCIYTCTYILIHITHLYTQRHEPEQARNVLNKYVNTYT